MGENLNHSQFRALAVWGLIAFDKCPKGRKAFKLKKTPYTKRRKYTRRLVTAALFAAMCYVMTMVAVPLPQGYGNLGDCFVLLSGWLLGPVWGAIAAGLGSAVADVAASYAIYAPATFVIKALMAVAAYYVGALISRRTSHFGRQLLSHVLAALVAESIMISGYFIYESILYDVATAVGTLVGNGMQGVVGAVLSTALITLVRRNKVLNGLFENEDKL